MIGIQVTSAVVGVGSSRKGNTIANGWLKCTSMRARYVNKEPPDYQVYVTVPPYYYFSLPMKNTRSVGAVWFNRRFTKPRCQQFKSSSEHKWNHGRHRVALGRPA